MKDDPQIPDFPKRAEEFCRLTTQSSPRGTGVPQCPIFLHLPDDHSDIAETRPEGPGRRRPTTGTRRAGVDPSAGSRQDFPGLSDMTVGTYSVAVAWILSLFCKSF